MFILADKNAAAENESVVIVWDIEKCIFYHLDIDSIRDGKNEMMLCFKNVRVKEDDLSEKHFLKQPNMLTDFMGFRAEDIINISRDKFNESFKEEYSRNDYKTGYQVFFYALKHVPKNYRTDPKILKLQKAIDLYELYLMRILYLGEELDLESLSVEDQTKLIFKKVVWEDGNYKEKDTIELWKDFFAQTQHFFFHEKRLVFSCKPHLEGREPDVRIPADVARLWFRYIMDKTNLCKEISVQVKQERGDISEEELSNEVQIRYDKAFSADYEIHSTFFDELEEMYRLSGMIFISDEYYKKFAWLKDLEIKTVQIEGLDAWYIILEIKKEHFEFKDREFYNDSYQKVDLNNQYIAHHVAEDCFPLLQVKEIPFEAYPEFADRKIISPISYQAYDEINKIVLKKNNSSNTKSVTMPYQQFHDIIVKQDEFQLLVDYVYQIQHDLDIQITPQKIRKEYDHYIRKIYDEISSSL